MDVDPAQELRERNLRVTPQRRAILAAFRGTPEEHLTADEVHARAAADVPEIGRGTVYATLAELSELGLLGSHGSAEPLRYERNTDRHDHFRCRLCLRLFDVRLDEPDTARLARAGYGVEHATVLAEGVCAECRAYDRGLRAGVKETNGTASMAEDLVGTLACITREGDLGTLAIAASERGLVRIAFEEHRDFHALAARARGRRGPRAGRQRAHASWEAIEGYLGGSREPISDLVDWEVAASANPAAVEATREVLWGSTRSYERLDVEELTPYACGHCMGTNPIPLILPCHRITRGVTPPESYIGGHERRMQLDRLESGA